MVFSKTRLLPSLLALLALPALAAEGGWDTVSTAPFVIKSRPRPGADIREVWAEGDLKASVADLQFALLDFPRYPAFMPYMKETWEAAPRNPPESRTVYSHLELPVVGGRDFTYKMYIDKSVRADGSGSFSNHWSALQNFVPERKGIKRLKVNEGSWTFTPVGDRVSHAVYRFAVDPGGWLPPFASDFGNRKATEETFKALEKEAQTHAAEPKPQARPAVPRPLESSRP